MCLTKYYNFLKFPSLCNIYCLMCFLSFCDFSGKPCGITWRNEETKLCSSSTLKLHRNHTAMKKGKWWLRSMRNSWGEMWNASWPFSGCKYKMFATLFKYLIFGGFFVSQFLASYAICVAVKVVPVVTLYFMHVSHFFETFSHLRDFHCRWVEKNQIFGCWKWSAKKNSALVSGYATLVSLSL